MKNFEVDEKTGVLKVYTKHGYIKVEPFGEGITAEVYSNALKDKCKFYDSDGTPGTDLVAVIENYDGGYVATIWADGSKEDPTDKLVFDLDL